MKGDCEEGGCGPPYKSISDILYRSASAETRRDLETFRKAFEKAHGPTDLTLRYTSTLPFAQQQWLAKYEPKRYFDGLPAFVKEYLRFQVKNFQRSGALDHLPSGIIQLMVKNQLDDGPSP